MKKRKRIKTKLYRAIKPN